jgi:hypothetical protein
LVRTVQQQGWAGLRNGALLLRIAAARFEVFVTADRNLQFQQNLTAVPFGGVVLNAQSTAIEDLVPLILGLRHEIGRVRPGEVRRVAAP